MRGLGRAGAVWAKGDNRDEIMTLQGQFLAERLWAHEAAHQTAGATLSEQQWEERRVMDVEQKIHRGTAKVFGEETIESRLAQVRTEDRAAYQAIHAARRYRLFRPILTTLIPGEETLERLSLRLYNRLQPHGQAMTESTQGGKKIEDLLQSWVAPKQLNYLESFANNLWLLRLYVKGKMAEGPDAFGTRMSALGIAELFGFRLLEEARKLHENSNAVLVPTPAALRPLVYFFNPFEEIVASHGLPGMSWDGESQEGADSPGVFLWSKSWTEVAAKTKENLALFAALPAVQRVAREHVELFAMPETERESFSQSDGSEISFLSHGQSVSHDGRGY